MKRTPKSGDDTEGGVSVEHFRASNIVPNEAQKTALQKDTF